MRGIELEEGEAYFLQDDDDENIDPDRDFSYLDRKIENVLGHYQKDFMGGLSAESLGARFGGYGSFLPMQQRSPPIIYNQKSQTHVSAKSPQNLPSERSRQNSTIAVNQSLPARSVPASGEQIVEAVPGPEIPLMNNQFKIEGYGEVASDQQNQKPKTHTSEKKSLKFRVKMAADNISCLDSSAIYSGLGLDMSPSSSPEDSLSENDGTSTGLQEFDLDSPSFIVKIMTAIPLSHNDLLSPLHDSLVRLRDMENYLETGLPATEKELPVNICHENMYSKEEKDARKDRKSKTKDAIKVKSSKHKEAIEERKSKQKVQGPFPVEMKENSSATERDDNGASTANEFVSNASFDAVDQYSEEKERAFLMGKCTGSKPSIMFDKRNEVLNEGIDDPMKLADVARHKAKEEPGSARKHLAKEEVENVITSKGKTEKDINFKFVPKSGSSTEKKDEVGWREDDLNKFSKQHGISKDKMKEEILESAHLEDKNIILIPKSESSTQQRKEDPQENEVNRVLKQQRMAVDQVKEERLDLPCPIEAGVLMKEKKIVNKISKDDEVRYPSLKTEKNDKYETVSDQIKFNNVNTLVLSKQKSHSREMTSSPAEQGLPKEKDNSSSVTKKKCKDSQIGGVSAAGPHRGSLIVSSSAKIEGVNFRDKFPPKSKKGDADLCREMRKNNQVAGKEHLRKKGKEVSGKDFVMGVREQEAQAFTSKLKDKSSANKIGYASNMGFNMEGDLAGVSCLSEKISVGDVPPAENAPVLTLEDWVECEKCHKWRLLPLGMSASSLTEKKWTCSMLTWLPGMNKCCFSEDDTTNALRALYVPLDPASLVQNNQPASVQNTFVNVSAGALNVLPNQATSFDALPSGSKKKNLVKTNIDAARLTGIQDLHIPVKKDQLNSGEMRNSKNLKKLPRELDYVRDSGDVRPSKIEKKRLPDAEVYGVPKKMKRVHQQSMEDYDPGALRVSLKMKGSPKYPLVKAKDKTQSDVTAKADEMYDVSAKKRKLKTRPQHDFSSVVPPGKGGQLVNNSDTGENSGIEHRKEKKLKSSNFQAKESRAGKGRLETQTDDAKSNLGGAGGSSLHEGGRADDIPVEQYHVDRVSRKTPSGRTFSEMALDLGLSDNLTTSSSSKISCKVKAKVNEMKSSPVGSISSSPIKVSKPDPDKATSEKSMSCYEQKLKSGAGSSANEFNPNNEGFRDRKSNLSRTSGIISDAADEYHLGKKVSSGRHSSSRSIDMQPKFEDIKDTGGKFSFTFEGTSNSQQSLVVANQMTKSPNKLRFNVTNTEKGKSNFTNISSEKEVSSNSRDVPECVGGSGANGGRVNNVNEKPSRQVAVDHGSLRKSHHAGHSSTDFETSSSRKKDSFHWAAKTALKEAKDLKHSADRLKVSGSGLESTGIFFQAALKFLQGASLLEPGNNEGRSGEMAPNDAYTNTAKLCEYCALEYERCNDMASAALAYKCMEVAYMRLVYCNDLAASRDRQELQMAVRATPQVESPSSSASDIDNLNQAAMDTVKDGHSAMDRRSHVVSAGNRPNFMRLLDFTHNINLAMEALRRSQGAFAAVRPVFTQAGNEEGIFPVKRVLDYSFHDVDGFLHLVRVAMESIKP